MPSSCFGGDSTPSSIADEQADAVSDVTDARSIGRSLFTDWNSLRLLSVYKYSKYSVMSSVVILAELVAKSVFSRSQFVDEQ